MMKKNSTGEYPFSTLEREALVASGIKTEEKLAEYIGKLDLLYQKVVPELEGHQNPVNKAKILFDRLWKENPSRYQFHGPFKFHHVIDAQVSKANRIVGNCLGLTLLYNCLLRRAGIHAEALYLEYAFDIGPHVLTALQTEEGIMDIENILPNGFDYRGHLNHSSRERWGDRELVADIYHSLGNDCFEKGEYLEALNSYEKAINLNPLYEKARLNRIICLDKMGLEVKA